MKVSLPLLEKLFYPLVLPRDLYISECMYQHELARSSALGIKPFLPIPNDLSKAFKPNTLFILGGGASINSFSDFHWETIASNLSIGINHWFVHPFEPDLLMLEGFRASQLNSSLHQWRRNSLPAYLLNSKVIFLLKDLASSNCDYDIFLKYAPSRIFSIPKYDIPGRSSLTKGIALKLISMTMLPEYRPLFARSSIFLAVILGLMIGVESIVLCGIDLSSSSYFWQAESFVPHASITLPPFSGQSSGSVHSTIRPDISSITIDRCLQHLNSFVLAKKSVSLFVASESSALYPSLPLYHWGA